jgi:hypothetical protein
MAGRPHNADYVPLKRGKPRGRFELMAVFPDFYVKYFSSNTKSLTPLEVVQAARKYADEIEKIIKAHNKRERQKAREAKAKK